MKKALKIFGLIAIGFVLGFLVSPSEITPTETVQEALPEEELTEEEFTQEETLAILEKQVEEQVEPTTVYEDERVKIGFLIATSEGAKFLVENKTSVNITIQADSVSVNGFSSNNITMSDDVSPNSKGYVIAQTGELADVGLAEKVSGNLRVIDFNESFESYDATFTDILITR